MSDFKEADQVSCVPMPVTAASRRDGRARASLPGAPARCARTTTSVCLPFRVTNLPFSFLPVSPTPCPTFALLITFVPFVNSRSRRIAAREGVPAAEWRLPRRQARARQAVEEGKSCLPTSNSNDSSNSGSSISVSLSVRLCIVCSFSPVISDLRALTVCCRLGSAKEKKRIRSIDTNDRPHTTLPFRVLDHSLSLFFAILVYDRPPSHAHQQTPTNN